jgi:hypothetical protein
VEEYKVYLYRAIFASGKVSEHMMSIKDDSVAIKCLNDIYKNDKVLSVTYIGEEYV